MVFLAYQTSGRKTDVPPLAMQILPILIRYYGASFLRSDSTKGLANQFSVMPGRVAWPPVAT